MGMSKETPVQLEYIDGKKIRSGKHEIFRKCPLLESGNSHIILLETFLRMSSVNKITEKTRNKATST